MERFGRIIIVGAANGLFGGIAGSVVGFAVALIFGLLWGDIDTFIPFMWLGGGLGAVTFALTGVLWDNGEQILLFRHGPGSIPKNEKTSGGLREPASPSDIAAPGQSDSPSRKPAVLFLCMGNSARSQMAEAFLKQQAGDTFEVLSAGFAPRPIHPLTFQVMSEVGIDLSGNRAKDLREFLGRKPVCCAITVCQELEAGCPTLWPGARRQLAWPFDDPAGEKPAEDQLAKFRTVRDQIREKIKSSLPELVTACSTGHLAN